MINARSVYLYRHKNPQPPYFLPGDSAGSVISNDYMEIQPNAFATELNRMITAKIGQRYLIIKLKIFFLFETFLPQEVTSSSIFFTPITLDIRRQVAMLQSAS